MVESTYNRTYIKKRPFCNIVLTIWFNESIFFSIHSELSLLISIFFIIFWLNGLKAFDSLVTVSEVHCRGRKWFEQVDFNHEIQRNQSWRTQERASHMHSDHNTEKWKIQKLQEKFPSKVKHREKYATFEPDGQKDMLKWRRPYVNWGKKWFSIFIAISWFRWMNISFSYTLHFISIKIKSPPLETNFEFFF